MLKDKTRYRILIVEDNPGDFTLVEDYLLDQIFDPAILRATSFKDAANLLLTEKTFFDIILLDLTLPDKSGKELINDFLKISSDCPVIVLTGYTDVDFSIQSVLLGVADYLIKDDLNGISLYKSIIYCLERRKKMLEVKESEKRYSDLFHLSPQPKWVYDIESLQFLDVNKAATEHYGYTEEEFLNLTLNDLKLDDDLTHHNKTIKHLEENKAKTFKGTFKHSKKNGEIILVDIQSNYILYRNKKAEINVITDITERSKYIQTIEKQNEKLKDIAWIQSHLVRAPLARILGLVDLLQKQSEEKTEEQIELLNYLTASAHELDSMIKAIADKTYVTQTEI